MSLLLEALKQAEREQREREAAAGGASRPAASGLAADPEPDAGSEPVCDFDLLEMEAIEPAPEPAPEPAAEPADEPAAEPASEPTAEEVSAEAEHAETAATDGSGQAQAAERASIPETPPPLFDDASEVLDSALGVDGTAEADGQPADTSVCTGRPAGGGGNDVETTLPPATAAHLLDRTLRQERASRKLMAGLAMLVLIGGVVGYRVFPVAWVIPPEGTASLAVPDPAGTELPGAEPMPAFPDLHEIRPVRLSGPDMESVLQETAATRLDEGGGMTRAGDQRMTTSAPVRRVPDAPELSVISAMGEADAADSSVPTVEVRVRTVPVASWRRRLDEAYRLLRMGEAHRARELYFTLRRDHPDEPEVLLGLASAELALNRVGEARALYRRILSQDPDNAFARAGLALTSGRADRVPDHVDDPAVLAALATAEAHRGDWRRAQALFFRAHASDPKNPDYLYGLAVSLDHLGKQALALDYYRQVLEAPGSAIDLEQVRRRIARLSRDTEEGEG